MTGISTTERSQGRYNQLERSRGYHTTGRKSRDIIPLEGNRRGYPASNRWDDSKRCVTVRIIPTVFVGIRDRHGFTKCHMSRRFLVQYLGRVGEFHAQYLGLSRLERVNCDTDQPETSQEKYQTTDRYSKGIPTIFLVIGIFGDLLDSLELAYSHPGTVSCRLTAISRLCNKVVQPPKQS